MMKIQKNGRTMTVPQGAYKELYKYTGWTPAEEEATDGHQKPSKGLEDLDLGKHTGEVEEGLKEPFSGSKPSLSEDETLEKMSDTELKQYAALLKINTKKLSDRAQLIQAIKNQRK